MTQRNRFVIALCLVVAPLWVASQWVAAEEPLISEESWIPKEDPVPQEGCSGELVHRTDPALAAELASRELKLLGTPKVTFVGNSKVSTSDFSTTDEDGNTDYGTVSCTLTCSGENCVQGGCEPKGGGCSSWSCGDGCTGTCTQTVTEWSN